MTDQRYPIEILTDDEDDGTMPERIAQLSEAVVGRRIVKAKKRVSQTSRRSRTDEFVIELDDGTEVVLTNNGDCCAYTELEAFMLNPELVEHAITGVGTSDGYTTWHIYADMGDVLALTIGWSAGNVGYYGYGFDMEVRSVTAPDGTPAA